MVKANVNCRVAADAHQRRLAPFTISGQALAPYRPSARAIATCRAGVTGSGARSPPWIEILRPDESRHGRALLRRAAGWWRKTCRRALYASFAGSCVTGRHVVESQAGGENHRARRDSRLRTASPSRPVASLSRVHRVRSARALLPAPEPPLDRQAMGVRQAASGRQDEAGPRRGSRSRAAYGSRSMSGSEA
jgi:hypothetical protein